ncbi:calcium homeostasis protein Regucalcin [Histoplasma capsulatum H143]|uniref:Calcium homeostasis protein Regucalcin n=1 Tax=Ajellomyces capsulatus (strain H143) TaxID=544712 RepID=C6H283_AJECH|nr:calcium homeostasis protein Regucalcin [Histoplasma capsulatum H143]
MGQMADLRVAELTNKSILNRLYLDQSVQMMIENMGMPNGIGWNEPDDGLGDSVKDTFGGSILMDDSDSETGEILRVSPEGNLIAGEIQMRTENVLWNLRGWNSASRLRMALLIIMIALRVTFKVDAGVKGNIWHKIQVPVPAVIGNWPGIKCSTHHSLFGIFLWFSLSFRSSALGFSQELCRKISIKEDFAMPLTQNNYCSCLSPTLQEGLVELQLGVLTEYERNKCRQTGNIPQLPRYVQSLGNIVSIRVLIKAPRCRGVADMRIHDRNSSDSFLVALKPYYLST